MSERIPEGQVSHVRRAQLHRFQGLLGVHQRIGPEDLDLDLALGPFRHTFLEMHDIVGARRSRAGRLGRHLEYDLGFGVARGPPPRPRPANLPSKKLANDFRYCRHILPFSDDSNLCRDAHASWPNVVRFGTPAASQVEEPFRIVTQHRLLVLPGHVVALHDLLDLVFRRRQIHLVRVVRRVSEGLDAYPARGRTPGSPSLPSQPSRIRPPLRYSTGRILGWSAASK